MRFLVTVAYDGSAFNGWQKQPQGHTVQGALEAALTKINKVPIHIVGSGRTDAGVHAHAQTFHFDSCVAMTPEQIKKAINTLTPSSLLVTDVQSVAEDFHARFDVQTKTYEYRLNTGPYNLFERKYVYQFNQALDYDKITQAMQAFVGTHDFTAFNATRVEEIPNQVRTIYAFECIQENETFIFRVTGTGFLRYMVRMMVGTCVACGLGKYDPQTIPKILEMKDKNSISFNIDPCGLYLLDVNYKVGGFS